MPETLKATAYLPGTKESLFLQRLKADTASHHLHLEAQPLLQALMMPDVKAQTYYSYLLTMKEVVSSYEKEVLPDIPSTQFAFTQRGVLSLIEQDVKNVGRLLQTHIDVTPFAVPGNLSLPTALGFAYVMEGSKLGGKVILKHIKKTIGFTEEKGASYLADGGADTATVWRIFMQQLSAYATASGVEEEIIQGAIAAFNSIHYYFDVNRAGYGV